MSDARLPKGAVRSTGRLFAGGAEGLGVSHVYGVADGDGGAIIHVAVPVVHVARFSHFVCGPTGIEAVVFITEVTAARVSL